LYPLERGFFFLPKPSTLILDEEVLFFLYAGNLFSSVHELMKAYHSPTIGTFNHNACLLLFNVDRVC
jgi:hypothetical protein